MIASVAYGPQAWHGPPNRGSQSLSPARAMASLLSHQSSLHHAYGRGNFDSRDAFELMLGSVSDNGHSLEDCKTYLTTPNGAYSLMRRVLLSSSAVQLYN